MRGKLRPNMETAGIVVLSRNLSQAPSLSGSPRRRALAALFACLVVLLVEPVARAHEIDPDAVAGHAWIGVVLAAHRAQVSAELDGRVVSLPLAAGTRVEAGAVLAVLEVPGLDAELDRAEASVALARAEVEEASATVRSRASEVERRHAAGASVSREDLGIAKGQLETAQARLASARARLRSAEADRSLFAVREARTRVTAPLGGVVGVHHVSVGDTVQNGALLMDLTDDSSVLVRFAVPSGETDSVSLGQTVWARRESGSAIEAVVTSMAPGVDPLAQLLRVEAQLTAPATGLLGRVVQVMPVVPAGAMSHGHQGSDSRGH